MTWDVTTAVLTSVFGTAMLIYAMYGIHAYLLPYLRRPKNDLGTTLPHVQRQSNPHLQQSLYSLPSLNYIDPRNSIADTELRSSRWSTNLQDLSRPTSLLSIPLTRSSPTHSRDASHSSLKSPVHARHVSSSTAVASTPRSMKLSRHAGKLELELGHKRHLGSQETISTRGKTHEMTTYYRARSKSDTLAMAQTGLLARSHATLCRQNIVETLSGPTTSTFSDKTLFSGYKTPSPRRLSGPCSTSAARVLSPPGGKGLGRIGLM